VQCKNNSPFHVKERLCFHGGEEKKGVEGGKGSHQSASKLRQLKGSERSLALLLKQLEKTWIVFNGSGALGFRGGRHKNNERGIEE